MLPGGSILCTRHTIGSMPTSTGPTWNPAYVPFSSSSAVPIRSRSSIHLSQSHRWTRYFHATAGGTGNRLVIRDRTVIGFPYIEGLRRETSAACTLPAAQLYVLGSGVNCDLLHADPNDHRRNRV